MTGLIVFIRRATATASLSVNWRFERVPWRSLDLGFEDGFDEFAGMHFLETVLPVLESIDLADDGVEIDLLGMDHPEDAFPDGPIV